MLPFTKRTARDEASELINTGDIEVVRHQKNASSFPPPPADRPRVFSRSVTDDEMTTLMPRKGAMAALSARLPGGLDPRTARSTSSRPKPVLMEEPTQAFVRPPNQNNAMTAPPSFSPPPAPPKPNMRHLTRPAPRQEIAPQSLAPMAMSAKQDSDAKIDPPATVITTRTRIITPRPTVSWAAALVAMGVFVGLVTAVIARGDADSLIDATASFVDPSGSHVSGASGGAIASLQSKFVAPTRAFSAMVDTASAPAASDESKSVAVADLPAAQAPKPPPVAYAAPARAWRSWRPAARPAPVAKQVKEVKEEPKAEAKEEKVAAAPAPKASSKHSAGGAAPAKAGASDDDVESASAADALAKAQLEASLR